MYQALYRKWRPKTFEEVVGQPHITDTLRRQVAEGRIAHAYLFTGTRGTGKTTCARILAKAVNCLEPRDGDPCCQCPACRAIDEGRVLDVTELDAASNNGVDQVRALREEAAYTPSVLRKRVYIIDEVHMLSTAAFNALLKILEEPPEHLLFILATTELHKVPATILSRCQRFSFKRILPEDMERHLRTVAQAEGIELTADGAEILSRMAGGALRDALSLLDQCRVIEGTLDAEAILQVLGLAGSIQTAELMERILVRDTAAVLAQFDGLYRSGKDVAALLGELSDLARDLTILKAAPEGGAALLTGLYDRKKLQTLGQDQSMRRFLYITDTLQSGRAALSDSVQPRIDAELTLLRLCDESLSGDLTALEARIARLETERCVAAPPPQPQERKISRAKEDEPAEESPVPQEAAPSAPSPAPKQMGGETDGGNLWEHLLDQYKARLAVNHRVFLNMAKGVLQADTLRVYCNNDFVQTSLDNNDVLSVLREVTSAAAGRDVRVELIAGKPPEGAASPASDHLDELVRSGSQLQQFRIK
ncbi:MAG: DNA polymerase III subunit gamma/tau [Oscillospiraceae bacterium]|nr:DNA polymerase III subunit gamma/tau [Oscillospiraceae bacterium]